MSDDGVHFTGPLLIWNSSAHANMGYIAITGAAAEEISGHEFIRRLELGRKRGFGSVKVDVTVGDSRWSTSVFPMGDGGWFLPMKAPIRRAEGLDEGEPVTVMLELR